MAPGDFDVPAQYSKGLATALVIGLMGQTDLAEIPARLDAMAAGAGDGWADVVDAGRGG